MGTGVAGATGGVSLLIDPRSVAAEGTTAAPWDPTHSYAAGSRVTFAGRTWEALRRTGRGQYPQGVGDGSAADRDLLLAQRGGFAAEVTGGAAGATYVVTSTADTNTPGTLRYALLQAQPLWIVFDKGLGPDVTIRLASRLKPAANKTVDGRGVNLTVVSSYDLSLKGLGTANHIWAYMHRVVSPVVSTYGASDGWNLDGAPTGTKVPTGFDLVWLHHVSLGQSGDGLLDAALAGPTRSRVTVDWCRFGPHPDVDAWVYAHDHGLLGLNNSPANGKTSLCGGDPQDGAAPDSLQMTFHHNLFRACVQRNVKVQRGRAHFFNNYVDRWGYPPLVTIPTDAAKHPDAVRYVETYQAGSRANATNPQHGTTGTEVGPDGELLAENNVYQAYAAGEEHVLSPALLAAGYLSEPWLVTVVKGAPLSRFPVKPKPSVPDPLVLARGNWSPNGALKDLNLQLHPDHVFRGVTYAADLSPYAALANGATRAAGDDWSGRPPYSYELAGADDRLMFDLDRATGNTQVWVPVS